MEKKGKEINTWGKEMVQEVVYRNPTQAFIDVRIGKRRIKESRGADGGQSDS